MGSMQKGFRVFKQTSLIRRTVQRWNALRHSRRGSIFVEYVLLVTIVGIGVIVGLATVRSALTNELMDLANAIEAINS